jgi:hypothetical protein
MNFFHDDDDDDDDEPTLLIYMSSGPRGSGTSFKHPVTGLAFVSKSAMQSFIFDRRPEVEFATNFVKAVQLVVIPDGIKEPSATARKYGTPFKNFGRFLKDGIDSNHIEEHSDDIAVITSGVKRVGLAVAMTTTAADNRERKKGAKPSRKPWKNNGPECGKKLCLPGHPSQIMVHSEFASEGYHMWALSCLSDRPQEIFGVMLPRFKSRIQDKTFTEKQEVVLEHIVDSARGPIIMILPGLTDDNLLAFDSGSAQSVNALLRVLEMILVPKTFTQYGLFRTMGYDPSYIQFYYERRSDPRFIMDRDAFIEGVQSPLKPIQVVGRINGYLLDRSGDVDDIDEDLEKAYIFRKFVSNFGENTSFSLRHLLREQTIWSQ